MAQKKYTIKQKVNASGVTKNVTANVVCEEAELDALLATLEGQYTVMAELKSGGNDTQTNSYNLLSRVTMKAEGSEAVFGSIFASNGGLVIKNTINADELTTIISSMHPFVGFPTLKPSYSSIKPVILAGARA